MTQEDKDLLLKDLCARLPYDVKVLYENEVFSIDSISAMYEEVKLDNTGNYTISIFDIKPYLFPLSSLTQKQMVEYYNTFYLDDNCNKFLTNKSLDWLYKNHIDIYDFISNGLAIDATGLNIY